MHPLWILLIGVAIVIVGILGLRLHAFLALVLAALVVGVLTPADRIEHYQVARNAVKIFGIDRSTGQLDLLTGPKDGTLRGMRFFVFRGEGTAALRQIGEVQIEWIDSLHGPDGRSREHAFAQFRPHVAGAVPRPTDLVIHPLAYRDAVRLSRQSVGERVAAGFGATCAKIGILIALAAVIGKCLLDSGAADRIVRAGLWLWGERGAAVSFLSSGFLLGIPVFFDTVFYLMIPLGKAMRIRTGRNYLLYVLTIVAGASMAHALVPPTPGPLFVAEQLGVDLGLMILAGCAVGVFTSLSGYLYARWANRIWDLPLRDSPEFSLADIQAQTERETSQLPPLWLSLLPIVLPVLLISGRTVLKALGGYLGGWLSAGAIDVLWSVTEVVGNKNVAMVIGTVIAMATLVWNRRMNMRKLSSSLTSALASGGVIILITAAGGAFGQTIQQTGIASLIDRLPQGSPLVVIPLAFLITAAVRTAQGSGTVAMITAVGILEGLAGAETLGFHPVYLALAIGCGSKPIAWMNDSGFWVISKMSGMTDAEALRYITPLSIIMGLVGLVVTLLAAWLLPLSGM